MREGAGPCHRFRDLPGSTKAYVNEHLRAACSGITFADIADAELCFDVIRDMYLAAASDLWEAIRFERARLEVRGAPALKFAHELPNGFHYITRSTW
jgi:hypothetical protein